MIRPLNSKLNPASVRLMLLDLNSGMTASQAAKKYRVSRATVYFVSVGRVWKDVYEKTLDEIEANEDGEPTEEELERLIAENYPTMPGVHEDEDDRP